MRLYFGTLVAPVTGTQSGDEVHVQKGMVGAGSSVHAHDIAFKKPVCLTQIGVVPRGADSAARTAPSRFQFELFAGLRHSLTSEHEDGGGGGDGGNDQIDERDKACYRRLQRQDTQFEYSEQETVQVLAIPQHLFKEPIDSLVVRGDFHAITLSIDGYVYTHSATSATAAVPAAAPTPADVDASDAAVKLEFLAVASANGGQRHVNDDENDEYKHDSGYNDDMIAYRDDEVEEEVMESGDVPRYDHDVIVVDNYHPETQVRSCRLLSQKLCKNNNENIQATAGLNGRRAASGETAMGWRRELLMNPPKRRRSQDVSPLMPPSIPSSTSGTGPLSPTDEARSRPSSGTAAVADVDSFEQSKLVIEDLLADATARTMSDPVFAHLLQEELVDAVKINSDLLVEWHGPSDGDALSALLSLRKDLPPLPGQLPPSTSALLTQVVMSRAEPQLAAALTSLSPLARQVDSLRACVEHNECDNDDFVAARESWERLSTEKKLYDDAHLDIIPATAYLFSTAAPLAAVSGLVGDVVGAIQRVLAEEWPLVRDLRRALLCVPELIQATSLFSSQEQLLLLASLFDQIALLAANQHVVASSVLDVLQVALAAAPWPRLLHHITVVPTDGRPSSSLLVAWLARTFSAAQPEPINRALYSALTLASAHCAFAAFTSSLNDLASASAALQQLLVALPQLMLPVHQQQQSCDANLHSVLRLLAHHNFVVSLASFISLVADPAADVPVRQLVALLLRSPEFRLWLVLRPEQFNVLLDAVSLRSGAASLDAHLNGASLELLELAAVPSFSFLFASLHATKDAAILLHKIWPGAASLTNNSDRTALLLHLHHLASSNLGKEVSKTVFVLFFPYVNSQKKKKFFFFFFSILQALSLLADATSSWSDLAHVIKTALQLVETHTTLSKSDEQMAALSAVEGAAILSSSSLIVKPLRDFYVDVFARTERGIRVLQQNNEVFDALTQWPIEWPSHMTSQNILEAVRFLGMPGAGGVPSLVNYLQRLHSFWPTADEPESSDKASASVSTGVAQPSATASALVAAATAQLHQQQQQVVSHWGVLSDGVGAGETDKAMATLEGVGVCLRQLCFLAAPAHQYTASSARMGQDTAGTNFIALSEAPLLSLASTALRIASKGLLMAHARFLLNPSLRVKWKRMFALDVAAPALQLLFSVLGSFYSDGKIKVYTRHFMPAVFALLRSVARTQEEGQLPLASVVHVHVRQLFSLLLSVQASPVVVPQQDEAVMISHATQDRFNLVSHTQKPVFADLCMLMLDSPGHYNGLLHLVLSLFPAAGASTAAVVSDAAYCNVIALQMEALGTELVPLTIILATNAVGGSAFAARMAFLRQLVDLGRPQIARLVIHSLCDALVALQTGMTNRQPSRTSGSTTASATTRPTRRATAAAIIQARQLSVLDAELEKSLSTTSAQNAVASVVGIVWAIGEIASSPCGRAALQSSLHARVNVLVLQAAEAIRANWPASAEDEGNIGTGLLGNISQVASLWHAWSVQAKPLIVDELAPLLDRLTEPTATTEATQTTEDSELRSLEASFRAPRAAADVAADELVFSELHSLTARCPPVLFPEGLVSSDPLDLLVRSTVKISQLLESDYFIPSAPSAASKEATNIHSPPPAVQPKPVITRSFKPMVKHYNLSGSSRAPSKHLDDFNHGHIVPSVKSIKIKTVKPARAPSSTEESKDRPILSKPPARALVIVKGNTDKRPPVSHTKPSTASKPQEYTGTCISLLT